MKLSRLVDKMVYNSGYQARIELQPRSTNPYQSLHLLFCWDCGWRHADMESLEKVKHNDDCQ